MPSHVKLMRDFFRPMRLKRNCAPVFDSSC